MYQKEVLILNSKNKLLIIDDDPEIITTIQLALTDRSDLEIIAFTEASGAFKFLKTEGFQGVILCDVQMPELDGWSFLRQLVEADQTSNIIFNMLTGVAVPQRTPKALPLMFTNT